MSCSDDHEAVQAAEAAIQRFAERFAERLTERLVQIETSEAGLKSLLDALVGLLGPGRPLRRDADRLGLTTGERLGLLLRLAGCVVMARRERRDRRRLQDLGRGDLGWMSDASPAEVLSLLTFGGWLAQQRQAGRFRRTRGQRADRQEREGFLSYLFLVFYDYGLKPTTLVEWRGQALTGDALAAGALADVARTLGPWADVELPADDRKLERVLSNVRKRAGIVGKPGRPARRPLI